MAKNLQIVRFRVSGETYGVSINAVHEVVRLMEITAIPDAPAGVEGVIDLRGRIIPVVDLRKLFGQREIVSSKKNRILVAEIGGQMFGLVVESAYEVLRVLQSEISPAPFAADNDGGYIVGVIRHRKQLVMLVDFQQLFRAHRFQPIRPLAEA
ncbi:MAG: chemotaxis protein CheW [Acidobacteriia bacterium]|nr:chemotaxis protein CheW [Terriglobia bacterium]